MGLKVNLVLKLFLVLLLGECRGIEVRDGVFEYKDCLISI